MKSIFCQLQIQKSYTSTPLAGQTANFAREVTHERNIINIIFFKFTKLIVNVLQTYQKDNYTVKKLNP